ncbi:MAG: PQQ-dependent dehydrogenase, methanol/ethanol family, partial [Pseudomonadota bacterium]|nr:PQQ-dependent dehydrogenase, methanol/ethanol family [Pseudomonadota bacterium]
MSKLLEKLLPALLASATLASPLSAQNGPSYGDILAGFSDPERWLTYSGDYSGKRHSPLQQITPENVSTLRPVWTFQPGTTTRGRGFETTP